MSSKNISEDDYTLFSEFLERRCGIVLGTNKQYLVRSRLSPLMRKYDYASLTQVINDVINGRDRALRCDAIDAMTTNETLWFRDKYPFELLSNDLFPRLSAKRQTIKIWCAASSSGQEPFSIAMMAHQYAKSNPSFPGVSITGTELSTEMLEKCENATYDNLSISRGLTEEHKRQFFDKVGDGTLKIKPEIQRMVNFKSLNLLDSFAGLGKFDIVFCRNVLIYFAPEVKANILQKIASVLSKEGILFLGASESMAGLSTEYDMVRCNPGLYYSKK
ncbi:MAG: CheR family methyltransferase [Aestuariibacter sp.]